MDDYFQKLKDYLLQQQREGEPVEDTRRKLIQHGWMAEMVDRAIMEIAPPRPPLPSVQLPEPLKRAHKQLAQQLDAHQASLTGQAKPGTHTQVRATDQSIRQQAPATGTIGAHLPKPSAQYGLLGAIADSALALKRNVVPFAAAAAISVIASVALFILADKVIYGIVSLNVLTSGASKAVVFATILLTSTLSFLISMTAYTLMQFATMYNVFEGGESRRTTIQQVIVHARKSIRKLLLANYMVGLLAVGPILLTSTIYRELNLAPLKVEGATATANGLTLLIWLAVLAWIVVVILRYALAPVAATFELDTSVWHSLRRSRQLLERGGKRFIGKLLVFVLITGTILLSFSGEKVRTLDKTDSPAVNAVLVLLAILVNGILVMYYRNRRMLKEPH